MISKFWQILGLLLRNSFFFSRLLLEHFCLTVGRINFGNKIPSIKELDVKVKNSHFVTNIVIWSEYIFWFTYVLRYIKKCLLSITSAKISEKTNQFLFLRKTLITYVSRNSYTSSIFSVSNIKYLFLETERNLKAAKNHAVVRSNVKIILVVKNSRKGHKIRTLSITSAKVSEKTNNLLFLRKTFYNENSYTSSIFSVANIKYLFLETELNWKAAKNHAVVRANVKIYGQWWLNP